LTKAKAKLSTWNGRLLTQAGRLSLTKSVLSSQPIYLLTVLKTYKKILQEIDGLRKRFLWAGDKELTGGKCKVTWTRCCLPKPNGGLLDLEKLARALRARWLWHEWTAMDKAWVGMETPFATRLTVSSLRPALP